MKPHTFETNVCITIAMIFIMVWFLLTQQFQAAITPLGFLAGWLFTEWVKTRLK